MKQTETDRQIVTFTFWMIVALIVSTRFLPASLETVVIGACLIPFTYNFFHGIVKPIANMEDNE